MVAEAGMLQEASMEGSTWGMRAGGAGGGMLQESSMESSTWAMRAGAAVAGAVVPGKVAGNGRGLLMVTRLTERTLPMMTPLKSTLAPVGRPLALTASTVTM